MHENTLQQQARQIIDQTVNSVFLTGKAGTGKSTFIKEVAASSAKRMVLVAPTGVAALNVKGATIHSFFQLPFGPLPPGDNRLDHKRIRGNKAKIMQKLDLLIIDEVSMVRADLMDAIDSTLRAVRDNPRVPFGGVQVLLVGDLFQLEPVVTQNDWPLLREHYETPFFFSSNAYKELDPVNIELTTVYRQQDEKFVDLLNRIRNNEMDEDTLERLNSRCNGHAPDDELYITLCATRQTAQQTNDFKLSCLNASEITLQGKTTGEFHPDLMPTDMGLKLKEGAQVMMVKNDIEKRWVNGSIGRIKSIGKEELLIEIEGKEHKVTTVTWDNTRYDFDNLKSAIKEQLVGTFTQFPVKLAWAITIHKSQGLTFHKVIIDLGNGAFAAGQVYVALSRCTTMEGLILRRPLTPKDIFVRPMVVEFYQNMNNSRKIAAALNAAM
ncbi:hypothetical protein BH09BAC1_BH09BAC1_29720 [soil metagenome]